MGNKREWKNWRIWVGLAALFVSGLVIGFLAGGTAEKKITARMLDAGPGERERLIMKRLTSMLDLTDNH